MVALGRKYDTGIFLSPTKEMCFLYLHVYTCYLDEDSFRAMRGTSSSIIAILLFNRSGNGNPFLDLSEGHQ